MKFKYQGYIWTALISLMMMFALFGCCSSDDCSDSSPAPATNTISGTAATGKPLVSGIVAVKGADNSTDLADISVRINEQGKFSASVSGLAAPYILRAKGKTAASDTTVELFSLATKPGVANITPLTNLLTWNVTGKDPTAAFAEWKDATANVNDATIDKKHNDLRKRLAPIMTALGLNPVGINMLRTRFNADHTGKDALLDVLDISVNSATSTITNRLTGYDITVDTTGDMTGDASFALSRMRGWKDGDDFNIESAVAISKFWTDIAKLYKVSAPTAADVSANIGTKLVPDKFLTEGNDASAELKVWSPGGHVTSGTRLFATIKRGMTVNELPVNDTTYDYNKGYWINLEYKMPSGMSGTTDTAMVYGENRNAPTDSKWLWYGDQKWIRVELVPLAEMTVDASGGAIAYKSKLKFELSDESGYARRNDATAALITGAGLPADGILMDNPTGDNFRIYSEASNDRNSSYLLSNDNIVGDFTPNSEYTVALYDNTSDRTLKGSLPYRDGRIEPYKGC